MRKTIEELEVLKGEKKLSNGAHQPGLSVIFLLSNVKITRTKNRIILAISVMLTKQRLLKDSIYDHIVEGKEKKMERFLALPLLLILLVLFLLYRS